MFEGKDVQMYDMPSELWTVRRYARVIDCLDGIYFYD
jgi:hypothetical protein